MPLVRRGGLRVHLGYLEALYARAGAGEGRFTASGCSVGECKLFSSLHCLVMLKAEVLDAYPGLRAFYLRFAAEPATKDFLETGSQYGHGILTQYFVW